MPSDSNKSYKVDQFGIRPRSASPIAHPIAHDEHRTVFRVAGIALVRVTDHVQRSTPLPYRCRGQPAIKGRQLSAMSDRHREQVCVRDLSRSLDARRVDDAAPYQAEIVRPETMARQGAQTAQQSELRQLGVPAEFGYLGLPTMRMTPFSVSGQVAHEAAPVAANQCAATSCSTCVGIDQRDQNIHVEQKGHGSSSRSALTMSRVTIALGCRTGSSGTPFRSGASTGGRSDVRAQVGYNLADRLTASPVRLPSPPRGCHHR